ncbi:MAG: hypothetical protein HGB03_01815 [Candidatus Yonathbacteria bacterium]|nr:hypothetical protein [Candidatus Yonathbacteria bacterium]NTW47996.1 hypothetical protein [Candidatus Yonathbacteria bacterium]
MNQSFFLAYRREGWTPDIVKKLATEYGKYGKDVSVVPDQHFLLQVEDCFSVAVPFLFKHLLNLHDVVFLYSEQFASRACVAHMSIAPGSYVVETYDDAAVTELRALSAPSAHVTGILAQENLVLKRASVPRDEVIDPDNHARNVAKRLRNVLQGMETYNDPFDGVGE